MKYCICGNKDFNKFVIEDIGFDHGNYNQKLTETQIKNIEKILSEKEKEIIQI